MKETQSQVLYEGLVAGLVGYLTVALVLGLVDVFAGHSFFYTAAALGQAMFGGSAEAGESVVSPGAVFAYNGVHLIAFLVFGFLVAWLVVETELHPTFWYVAFFIPLGVFFFVTVVAAGFGEALGGALPWWSVILANVLAALAMGAYLHRAHPSLLRELKEHGDPNLGGGADLMVIASHGRTGLETASRSSPGSSTLGPPLRPRCREELVDPLAYVATTVATAAVVVEKRRGAG